MIFIDAEGPLMPLVGILSFLHQIIEGYDDGRHDARMTGGSPWLVSDVGRAAILHMDMFLGGISDANISGMCE